MLSAGIKPSDFEKVYEIATVIYNSTPNEGPFGVDHLVQAAKRFNESQKAYVVYKKPESKAMVSCSTCQGSKISFLYEDGKLVGIERDEEGKIRKCRDCEGI